MKKWQKKILNELKIVADLKQNHSHFLIEMDTLAPVLAAFNLDTSKNCIVVTPNLGMAESAVDDLDNFTTALGKDSAIHLLPESGSGIQDVRFDQNQRERCRIYSQTNQKKTIFFTSISSFLAPVPNPKQFNDQTITLNTGSNSWPPEKLSRILISLDYDNEAQVSLPGEFSWRGGILDLYSPENGNPIRIEYWGETIDSLRLFDPETQRSIKEIDQTTVIPCNSSSEKKNTFHFLDFFPLDSVFLVICAPKKIDQFMCASNNGDFSITWEKILSQKHRKIFLEEKLERHPIETGKEINQFFSLAHLSNSFLPETENSLLILQNQFLTSQLQQWSQDDYSIVFFATQKNSHDKFKKLLKKKKKAKPCSVSFENTHLPSGLIFTESKIVLLSETELVGRPKKMGTRSKKKLFHPHQILTSHEDLVEGDLAVHAAYGVCRYLGLQKQLFSDRVQEVMVLEFADDGKLMVALDQSYLIARYVGASKKLPKLSRIGSVIWNKARQAAETAVKDIASDLIRIQAVRNCTPGFAFINENEEDIVKFTDSFPFEETEDQKLAIHEVFVDMELPRPMDRLICGDVGYGKTEVAMRAVCKAITYGKQVALLVPTTVLAQQHYLTLLDRFSEFPLMIECISRFRSRKEQRQILANLSEGKIDVIIGTHRLLQPDIKFQDLGLIIIDEEQRFGVLHKEKLKKLRANADILTLTATPIPRTLYLSIAGLRDMSTISTAPQDRLPVKTIVAQIDDELIVEAITHETDRCGQVFYLHNRIQTIYSVHEKLEQLFPNLTILVAHGRMEESELEATMVRFIQGKADVLVCTTIIESGLDIPNANTIIIDRADRFGLAELYQLRGRVGRYDRQAYAYLLIPKNLVVLENAKKRLAAIKKYTQLGAGFKLALKDLEIRGAGNIIGAEQSGHISAIGFSLYCQILKEAVARLKNQPSTIRKEVNLDLDFIVFGTSESDRLGAFIPPNFVQDDDLRVGCYRRLSLMTEVGLVTDFEKELKDRFGILPNSVQNLLKLTKLKIVCAENSIHSISVKNRRVVLRTEHGLLQLREKRFPRLESENPGDFLDELQDLVSHSKIDHPSKSIVPKNKKKVLLSERSMV